MMQGFIRNLNDGIEKTLKGELVEEALGGVTPKPQSDVAQKLEQLWKTGKEVIIMIV